MRIFGLFLIAVSLLVPLVWTLEMAGVHPKAALFSQYLGVLALLSMSIAQILAARLPGAEFLFGGLDRIYVLHKWLAVFAMVCLGLHEIIDAEIDGLGPETGLMDIAEDVGEIALYGLLILVFVTVTTFIPYQYWRWSHQFIGLFFAMGVFHYVFVQKPYGQLDPPSLYVLFFCAAGLLSYLYMVLLYVRFPGPRRYRVVNCLAFGDATEIVMAPESKRIRHKPGQFAFFEFDLPGMTEIHPFTIAGGPQENGELRICVKGLGTYTDDLIKTVKPDVAVNVFGSFGHFRMPSDDRPQIWIAAGIGITPFMSWARSLKASEVKSPIHLYYCIRSEDDAPFIDELRAIAQANPTFKLSLHNSVRDGRLVTERIADANAELKNTFVGFCGPTAMRNELRSGLVAKGLKKSRFHFEEFEIRTSVGLLSIAEWVLKRFR